jgi:hypothetical protein
MLGNSWVAAQLAASHEGLSSMESVSYVILPHCEYLAYISPNSEINSEFQKMEKEAVMA